MAETDTVRGKVIDRALAGSSENGHGANGAVALEENERQYVDADIDDAGIGRVTEDYTADSLRLLEGVEHVRLRPSMYISDTGSDGLHHLMFEIIDNSIDEVLAGHADEIWVILHKDKSITVRDNGRGIPTGINAQTGMSGVELAMTKLMAGGKFGGGGYKVSGGLHGVGLSIVNFLSEWCDAVVEQDGKMFKIHCERGIPTGPLKLIGDSERHGTTITWLPDTQIFGEFEYKPEQFESRIRDTCYLNRMITIHFHDEQSGSEPVTYHYERGIQELVEHLNENKDGFGDVIYFFKSKLDDRGQAVEAEIALQYNQTYTETVLSFANNVHTKFGGTHLSGFRTALTRVINQYARKTGAIKEKDNNLSGDDAREGLTAVISVRLHHPQFEAQTKLKLTNPDVEGIVNSIMGEGLGQFLEENPQVARKIIEKAITAQRARDAARKAADLIKRQNSLENSNLPGKLADCTERDPRKCELFLVEGDSAGGSAKQGRDRRYQAILPLRGKIINVGKAALDKTLENNEVRSLITALGIGIKVDSDDDEDTGESTSKFDMSRLRYHRIIIMTDADVDGSHIRTLLLTFFFSYMLPLVEQGHVYRAMPPLYAIKSGKDFKKYVGSEEERDAVLKDLKRKDAQVTRFKGLGEMNSDDLYDTTMNIETRKLARVTMEDAEKAAQMFSILMSEKVDPRKQYIIQHAKAVSDVDWHC
jgi:DNA gyrase subunit B